MHRRGVNFITIDLSGMGIGLLVACFVLSATGAQAQTRNAIFNGTFTEGTTGFGVLGPGYQNAALTADKSQLAQVLVTEMIVSSPGMERTFSVYSTYLLRVQKGQSYTMVLRMAGEGQFSFGAFEYDAGGHHIGNNYSERYVLSPELKDYTFTYTPSENAVGIRPSIVFLERTDATPMDVRARIRSFELRAPVDEFARMCESWPEYAKDDSFTSYPGFSPEELAELEQIAAVDTVLPPYEPIRMGEEGDFALTTSRIRFGQRIFPDSVSILGQEVLARPMEFTVEYADGTHTSLQPSRLSIDCADQRAVLRQRFRDGEREVRIGLQMEYDAFLIYTVTIPPTPGATLTGASLTIPVRSERARYIDYHRFDIPRAGGHGDWVFGYGPIPAVGEKVETSHTVGSEHMGGAIKNDWAPAVPADDGLIWEWSKGFLHTVWVGDEKRGVSLISMSRQGYSAAEGEPTVRLARNGDEVSLTYRFISQPVSVDAGREFQFALQMMPPKPVRADWFHARYNPVFPGYQEIVDQALDVFETQTAPDAAAQGPTPSYGTAYDMIRKSAVPGRWESREHRAHRDVGFLWYTLWARGSRGAGLPVGGCSTPLVGHPERLNRVLNCCSAIGHRALPYFAGTHIASEDPAGYYYVERTNEWTALPRIPRPPYLRPTCPNSLFSAYIARGIGRLIDEYGIEGVYFDNCGANMCTNTGHGCGYVDEEGIVQPTLPILGFRRLFMMVRNEFVKRGKDPYILIHAGMNPGVVSFIDAELDGEGTYGSDHTQMITLGEWRARLIGPHQFGVQQNYLPSFGYGMGPDVDRAEQEVIGTPRLLAMSLLHGTHIWQQYADAPAVYATWGVLDELDEPDVAFIPYWDWPELNHALNADGVYATGYNGTTRLILVLTNLSDTQREVEFPLSEIRAHLPAAGRVADNLHGSPVSIEGGLVRCTIEPKNLRLLSFTE
ncbi:MAG TPA: hypothetical protein DGT21_04290 [Armatimonadetes bacterium]|nr:hypothetical protein [Armatimonadota bacterium]